MMDKDVEQLIAEALGIPRKRVTPQLEFGAVAEWDSLGHVTLMLALEERTGTEIDAERMVELTTVGAISQYVDAAA
jgi:citrate synthase